jgi:NADP-dependent 3-hydroxy acid dehydrogenase YdfG
MDNDISGRTVWITGAGSGIGQAMAEAFAAAGARVALTGRRRDALEQTAAALKGPPALVLPGDIGDRAGMRATVERILADTGRLDILCANAGLNRPRRYWADLAADPDAAWPEWDEVLDVNVRGVLNCIAPALVPMRAQRDGQVIITSSWAGRFPSEKGGVAYGAAKHATCDICASINSQEGRHGIRATSLNPAEVATPLLLKRPGFDASSAPQMIQPADMAASALYAARMPKNVAVHEITLAPVRGKT